MSNAPKGLRLLIVDDHPVVVTGCKAIFSGRPDIAITDVGDGALGIEAYFALAPDVALIDINLPGISGYEVIRRIVERDPEAKLIGFSMNEDPAIAVRAIEMGARAFLTKTDSPEYYVNAVQAVAEGDSYLTPAMAREVAFLHARTEERKDRLSPRDAEILRLLGEGRSMGDIADLLDVSYKTIANNVTQLKNKLGARTTQDLMRLAIESVKPS